MPPQKGPPKASLDVKITNKHRISNAKVTVKKTTQVKTLRQKRNLNATSPLSTSSSFRTDRIGIPATDSPPKSSPFGSRSLADTPTSFNSDFSRGSQTPLVPKGAPLKKNNGGRSHSLPNLMRSNSNTPSYSEIGHGNKGFQLFINEDLPTTKPLPAIKASSSATSFSSNQSKTSLRGAHNRIQEGVSEIEIEKGNWRLKKVFNPDRHILQISKGDSEVIGEHIQWINDQIQKKTSPADKPRRQEVNNYVDYNSEPRIAKANFDGGDTLVVSLLKKNQSPINSPEEPKDESDFVVRLVLLKGLLEQYNVKLTDYSDAYKTLSNNIKMIGNDLDNERLRSNNLNKQLIDSTVQLQKSIDSATQLKSKYDLKFTELLAATSEIEILKTKVKELVRRYSPKDQLKLQETLRLNTELEGELLEIREIVRKQNIQIKDLQIEMPKIQEEHQIEINETKAMHEEQKQALTIELDSVKEQLWNAQSDAPDVRAMATQTEEQQSCFRVTFWSCLTCCGLCESKRIGPNYR